MIKFLIGLITAVTSFIGLIGNTNSALANPTIEPIVRDSLEQPVNLNISSSLWQLNHDSKDIFDHLGCSCAACSQFD